MRRAYERIPIYTADVSGVCSALYELVNTRLVAGRCTVISSNLSITEAAQRYAPQIASRLEGEYHVLHFFGDDIRLLKKRRM